jgi:Na+-driven multidrug efflux pump
MITSGMNAYINTQGFAKMGMSTVLLGAITNIVLDPIFIFVFEMGIRGAALATIISQGLSALWVLYFFKNKSPLKIRKEYLGIDMKVLGSIMMLGISPFIMNTTESILQISFNNQLALYGGSMAVASMSILMSLYQIITMPLSGIVQGGQPIMSYNFGAQNYARVKNTFKLEFKICLIMWLKFRF